MCINWPPPAAATAVQQRSSSVGNDDAFAFWLLCTFCTKLHEPRTQQRLLPLLVSMNRIMGEFLVRGKTSQQTVQNLMEKQLVGYGGGGGGGDSRSGARAQRDPRRERRPDVHQLFPGSTVRCGTGRREAGGHHREELRERRLHAHGGGGLRHRPAAEAVPGHDRRDGRAARQFVQIVADHGGQHVHGGLPKEALVRQDHHHPLARVAQGAVPGR